MDPEFDPEDPLPAIAPSPIRLGVETVAVLPASTQDGAAARVQQVVPVPGLAETLAAVDTRGVIWLVEGGEVRETPLLDLRDGTLGFEVFGGESGLRSIAFHPDFATPGAPGSAKFYVGFSAATASPADVPRFTTPGNTAFDDVVLELTVPDAADPIADLASARELMRLAQPFTNHNLGNLGFEPGLAPEDPGYGLLHIAVGDGGSGGDPLDLAGELSSPFGKLLRIDPLGREGVLPYAIPADNPFAGADGALGEILAYGFRNPQTWSFDAERIWLADIGQNAVEEIDILAVGAHHGWNEREGTFLFDGGIAPLPADDAAFGFQYPITQYDHAEIAAGGVAVAGGFVYRGEDVPGLEGQYLFANFPDGRVFTLATSGLDEVLADGLVAPDETRPPLELGFLAADGTETSFSEMVGSGRVDLRFGQDAAGEILVFTKTDGTIYRLTAPSGLGAGLSEDEAAAVAALYEAALDRDGEIDAAGLNFWIDAREAGLSEAALSGAFLASGEFEAAFGNPDALEDGTFVRLLYRNLLEREGEQTGVDFWTSALERPMFDRADLLFAFATSEENSEGLGALDRLTEVAPGVWDFAG